MNAIVPGTSRYSRSLGFVGAVEARQENALERFTGIDVSYRDVGGRDAWSVGTMPSTLMAVVLGTFIGSALRKNLMGAVMGAAAGAVIATGLRTAGQKNF